MKIKSSFLIKARPIKRFRFLVSAKGRLQKKSLEIFQNGGVGVAYCTVLYSTPVKEAPGFILRLSKMLVARPPANGFWRNLLHNSWKIDSFLGKLFWIWFLMGSVSMDYHFCHVLTVCFIFFIYCFVHLYSHWPIRKFDIINKGK